MKTTQGPLMYTTAKYSRILTEIFTTAREKRKFTTKTYE